jgi:F-type H+-transporting ATPase subunit epsilon
MPDKLHFSLVSPSRELFSGDVEHVIAPGMEGEFGVLPQHAPFMTLLKNGVVRVLEGNDVRMRVYVRGGFADVTPQGITILAEAARDLSDVDAQKVDSEIEDVKRKALSLDEGDPARLALTEQIAFLEGLRAAVAN